MLPSLLLSLLASDSVIAFDRPALALPLVFASGVLTSLTPCIYPMIPITAAIVGGQTLGAAPGAPSAPRAPRARVLGLTLAYVAGLAFVYAGLGLFAGMTGSMFGAVSTNPWLYFLMANLLLLSALAMLDVLPVRLPAALVQRAATAGTGGRVAGAAIMGAASGLVAAPCSAPVMVAVLTWVAATRSAGLGFLYLLAFSFGMCTLLVVVGVSAGAVSRLPRAGTWMVWVKRGFAFVMLGVAEYYLVKMGQLLI
ncbi:MAG: cytochrome c biogenesis protein CcdA [Gemmatimonadaceae bacterium]